MAWQAERSEIAALLGARHDNPFGLLGLQDTPHGLALRAFVPGAQRLWADFADISIPLALVEEGGFYEALIPGERRPYTLRAENAAAIWVLEDPYRFAPILGALDDYLLAEGTHRALYERLGAHPITHEDVAGVHFAVWAPGAQRVSVVGDFNAWDGRRHQMRKRLGSGVFEIFAPSIGPGAVYKYEIIGADGSILPLKADPMGQQAELRPSTASIVASPLAHAWTDAAWMQARAVPNQRRQPISIYEVHLGSFMRGEGNRFLRWEEVAARLIPYAVQLGFTHLQLMPLSEHPLDQSWGYQPIGLFAPTARFGDPDGLAFLVDAAHRAGLGVLLDWVPAHFPVDPHGLAWFDGTALYEHADPRQGFHPDWNTAIYNFGRTEVANILAASAMAWLDRFHIDGLRVDAVASMLYLDYSREPGQWLPNREGGNANLEAIAFLRQVNIMAHALHPGVMMVAEESTAWPCVSAPVHAGGLGFGFKWNMGWMNDTLAYLSQDPVHRRWHHDKMTFGLLYGFSENYVLPLSHDEVVHGKGALLEKIPGDDWQKFATLRAYYGFMWGHPGKKLLFMGQEFAQRREWNSDQSLDWHLLEHASHRGVQDCLRDLNHRYRELHALHARDCEPEGFVWIIGDDRENAVFAWLRLGGEADDIVAVICNFTPIPRTQYRIGLPKPGRWTECLNTDAAPYGGSGLGNLGGVRATGEPSHGQPASALLTLPPLATLYLRFENTTESHGP